MKIAVTGASGFIGRHVLAELSRHPVEVIAATRNAAKLVDVAKNVHVVELDISNPQSNDYEQLHRPDVLIHLAWGVCHSTSYYTILRQKCHGNIGFFRVLYELVYLLYW